MQYFAILLCILLSAVSCNLQEEPTQLTKVIATDTEEITIVYNKQLIPWSVAEDDLSFPYNGDFNEIGFITSTDTVSFKLFPADTIPLQFILNKRDTIKAAAIGQAKPANFSKGYIDQNTGKYQVYSPKVHELVNISVALTNIGKLDSNMVYMESDYYKRMRTHFDPYKNHALIDSLNQHITEVFGTSTYNYYYNIRMNACMYSFDEEQIVNVSPYDRLGFGGENLLTDLLPLLEDFSAISNFETFYQENENYYESLIDTYYELVPIDKMWDWVEAKFPQRYEAYKIYFSPLVNGAHSTPKFSDNDYKETIMFIDAPTFGDEYTSVEKETILTRIVFTEIDHNYVNPTTDAFSEIGSLMDPLECWNNGAQGYDSSYFTFNEYMTWAVFTLYLYDNFDTETFEERNRNEAYFMANGRGFIKYQAFNEVALNWYKRNPDAPLKELYPVMFEWIRNEPCD